MLELAKNYHKACVGRIILKHIKEWENCWSNVELQHCL
jgi:hypothetical protein